MAKYNVYGIGAALVDTEVEVSDRFLADAKVNKGVMTLVDELRQRELLQSLSSEDLNLVKKCGGSVCNSVVASSSLGSKAFFSGKVADDADGELYVNDLNEAGVDFHSADPDPGTTGKCLVMVTEDAERTMNTFLGVSESLSSKEIDNEALKDSEWLYFESYLLTYEAGTKTIKEAVEFAKEHGVKIAISLSDPLVVSVFGGRLRDILVDGVDLIFCNKEEAFAFAGSDDLDNATKNLMQYTKNFVITDGANGALIYDGESIIRSESVSAKVIDTNGAGDMFAGAFLHAITSGKTYAWASDLANYCASRVVEQFSPRLAMEDFKKIKAKFGI